MRKSPACILTLYIHLHVTINGLLTSQSGFSFFTPIEDRLFIFLTFQRYNNYILGLRATVHVSSLLLGFDTIENRGCQRRVSQFSLGCGIWFSPRDSPTPRRTWVAQTGFRGLLKKRHETGVGYIQELGEKRQEYDDNKWYTCMKFWKNSIKTSYICIKQTLSMHREA